VACLCRAANEQQGNRIQSLPDRHEWSFQYLMQINGKRRDCGIVATHPGEGEVQKLNTIMLCKITYR
jgi:hypothetical protein